MELFNDIRHKDPPECRVGSQRPTVCLDRAVPIGAEPDARARQAAQMIAGEPFAMGRLCAFGFKACGPRVCCALRAGVLYRRFPSRRLSSRLTKISPGDGLRVRVTLREPLR